jgi:molybdopterin-guanine dinucleotide biosynthesis protein A
MPAERDAVSAEDASRRAAIAVSTAPVTTVGLYRRSPARSRDSAAVSQIVSTNGVDVARRMGTVASMPDVVLPVLDEAGAIPAVLARFPRDYEPIVVDNGSTDGSAKLALSFGARVVVEQARGFGAACFAGLRAATSDVVCFMDCDGSLDPRDLPLVTSPVLDGEADLVLGARHPTGAGVWPLHARLANRALARLMARRVGGRVHDLGPMRSARRDALLELGMTDRRFGWPLEMVVLAAAADWRVVEVPVSYAPRIGRSKVTGTVRGTARAVFDMARAMS